MNLDVWTAVDHYFEGAFTAPDPILEAVLTNSTAAGLPAINVSPAQGKLLLLLAQMQHASDTPQPLKRRGFLWSRVSGEPFGSK